MFDPQALLDRLAPCMDAPAWRLGLSGGLDSMVLLYALSLLRGSSELPPISAVHVHHGLHADADRWAAQCADACRRAGVPLRVVQVSVGPGASVENAARDARYAAFEAVLEPGEVLLLAHHRDDQVETLLFRLLRGTGLRGLAGMPLRRSLGSGILFRPLLDWSRSQLHGWAQQQGLTWIEDPANSDLRFARTALRHDILPRMRATWSMADNSLLRLAGHVGEALELLDERAEEDWRQVAPPPGDPWFHGWPALLTEPLLGLSSARQANLLRFWLHRHGCQMPDQRQHHELISQLAARHDSQPSIALDRYRLMRAGGYLWLLPQHMPVPRPQRIEPARQVDLPDNGRLFFEPGPGGLRGEGEWEVRYRQGGETIRPAGRPSQSLKHLLQDASIPTWLRERVPLLYCDGLLVSVGGRWQAEAGCVGPAETGWHVRWEPQAAQ